MTIDRTPNKCYTTHISKLNDLRDEVLALRDEANHDEYARYGELYEAVTEAFDIANRNFPGAYGVEG